jgi:DNA-directed RNA polymerase specialized sigma24 family protein
MSNVATRAITAICENYRRCYPGLDVDDMRQEAALAAWTARRTWRRGGAPLPQYQARAALFAVRRYCAKARSPVSGQIPALGKTSATSIDCVELTFPGSAPDEYFYRRRLSAEIRRILYGVRDGHLAALVLLDEYKAAEVVRERGCTLSDVYQATHRAYRALARSKQLREYAGA